MIELITSILGGGVTGLLGKGLERYFDHKAKKLELELENQRFNHQLALQQAIGKSAVEVEDSKAFKASIESDKVDKFYEGKYTKSQSWLMVILDFCRGFIRIGLTAYLCLLTTLVYFQAKALLSIDFILPSMAYDMVILIIHTILYLTTLSISWQFGSRGSNAPINK